MDIKAIGVYLHCFFLVLELILRLEDVNQKRFWAKVNKSSGCWEWTAYTDSWGYGRFQVKGKSKLAHRISYLLEHRVLPADLKVCHTCDNPKCVNPSHLFLGTDADNVKDRDSKGRRKPLQGVRHGRAKLSEQDVLGIRNSTLSHVTLAKQYGVSAVQISTIRKRKQWTHI